MKDQCVWAFPCSQPYSQHPFIEFLAGSRTEIAWVAGILIVCVTVFLVARMLSKVAADVAAEGERNKNG